MEGLDMRNNDILFSIKIVRTISLLSKDYHFAKVLYNCVLLD